MRSEKEVEQMATKGDVFAALTAPPKGAA